NIATIVAPRQSKLVATRIVVKRSVTTIRGEAFARSALPPLSPQTKLRKLRTPVRWTPTPPA
ncbi:MAG: hypothetical protein ACYDBP_14675, partial [Leptospirales bacterium]